MTMKSQRRAERTETINRVLDGARSHMGYRWNPATSTDNYFLHTVGYPTYKSWDGAFLDVVLRQAGVSGPDMPAHINTASAIEFYIRNGLTVRDPANGDIWFSTDGRVGLVTDAGTWKADRTFRSIEAQVNSGLPRAAKERDGVFERNRDSTEVLVFARPVYEKLRHLNQAKPTSTRQPLIKPSNFVNGSPKMSSSTEILQLALERHPGLNLQQAIRGKFDMKMRRAIMRLQLHYGYLPEDATGLPDEPTLDRLARESGLFRTSAVPLDGEPSPE